MGSAVYSVASASWLGEITALILTNSSQKKTLVTPRRNLVV